MALPLGLLLAPAAAKLAIGGLQTIFGKRREDRLDRPERQISPAIQEGVSRTRYLTQGEDPQVEFMRQQAAANQAGAVSQIEKAGGSAATTMAAALGAQKQASDTNLQAGQMGQQFKLGANMQYLRMLQNLAQEQQMNFEWNQAQKFQEEAAAARRLKESGMQNMITGLTDAAGGAFAFKNLMGQDETQSPYWNQKMGYMGTAEMFQAQQKSAMDNYMKSIAQAPATNVPMHGKFGEGINTTGYMNQWMPEMPAIPELPQLPKMPMIMGP